MKFTSINHNNEQILNPNIKVDLNLTFIFWFIMVQDLILIETSDHYCIYNLSLKVNLFIKIFFVTIFWYFITLFRSIIGLCGTNNILQNIPQIQL